MITTADTFAIAEDTRQRFNGASIYCIPTYYEDIGNTYVVANVVEKIGAVDTGILASFTLEFTNDELYAVSGSVTATGYTDQFYNMVELVMVQHLAALTPNSGVTFNLL